MKRLTDGMADRLAAGIHTDPKNSPKTQPPPGHHNAPRHTPPPRSTSPHSLRLTLLATNCDGGEGMPWPLAWHWRGGGKRRQTVQATRQGERLWGTKAPLERQVTQNGQRGRREARQERDKARREQDRQDRLSVSQTGETNKQNRQTRPDPAAVRGSSCRVHMQCLPMIRPLCHSPTPRLLAHDA